MFEFLLFLSLSIGFLGVGVTVAGSKVSRDAPITQDSKKSSKNTSEK